VRIGSSSADAVAGCRAVRVGRKEGGELTLMEEKQETQTPHRYWFLILTVCARLLEASSSLWKLVTWRGAMKSCAAD